MKSIKQISQLSEYELRGIINGDPETLDRMISQTLLSSDLTLAAESYAKSFGSRLAQAYQVMIEQTISEEFFSMLEEEHRKGVTIFMSSHILSEIESHAETAAAIREGRIIVSGKVEEISKTNARRVSLRGKADISTLTGVKEVVEDKNGMSFLYSGEASALLEALNKGSVKDFTVTEPDLEEVFLHYYRKEEKA